VTWAAFNVVFLADICTAATWDSLWLLSQGQICFSGATLTTFSGDCGGMKEDTSCVSVLGSRKLPKLVFFGQ